jgi:DNA-binding response OmpR family regulator
MLQAALAHPPSPDHGASFRPHLEVAPGALAWGPLHVDLVRGVARVDDRELELQTLQLRILAFLMLRAGAIVTREELRVNLFRATQAPRSTGITRQVSVLRAQLGRFACLIATERGGYALRYPNLREPSAIEGRAGERGS